MLTRLVVISFFALCVLFCFPVCKPSWVHMLSRTFGCCWEQLRNLRLQSHSLQLGRASLGLSIANYTGI